MSPNPVLWVCIVLGAHLSSWRQEINYSLDSLATLREDFEFHAVRLLVAALRVLPRNAARAVGAVIGSTAQLAFPKLQRIADINLNLAYPEWTARERALVIHQVFRNLGWQLAEFCQMSRYTADSVKAFARCEGMQHYLAAKARGKGVLIITGHLGAWELSSFYHSLLGHPMSMVIRRLDNPRVDRLVNDIRCLHGNRVLHKDDFARGLLSAMRSNQTVGILMDTNMTPPQGVFVPFFGIEACTASGLARIALKTDATVLPGYMIWQPSEQKYVLHFGPVIPLLRSGQAETGPDASPETGPEADIIANTAQFTRAIEEAVRQYPDQWLWVHRRWKTRPPGQPPLY